MNSIRKTDDFEAWILFSTFEYAEEIAQLMHLNWSLGVMMRTHEVIHANDEELSRLSAAFRLVLTHQASPARPNKQNSIKLLLCSMLYELNDIQSRQKEPLPMRTYTSAEHLFQRFAKLVNDAQPPFTSLTDYAQKLCVTPKYLHFSPRLPKEKNGIRQGGRNRYLTPKKRKNTPRYTYWNAPWCTRLNVPRCTCATTPWYIFRAQIVWQIASKNVARSFEKYCPSFWKTLPVIFSPVAHEFFSSCP